MRGSFHARLVLACLTGVAVATAAAGRAAAADSYDIAVILPLTGGAAFLGKAERDALQVAEKVANRSGGIHGVPLRFVFRDDQSSPQVAVQLASQAAAAHPAVVIGSTIVAMCNAMAPLMRAGPMMYCLSPGVHPEKGAYVFSSSVSTHDLAEVLIRFFHRSGWTRMAMITSTDATGQDAERGILEILAQPEFKDVQMVERSHFNPGDATVSAQIERIKGAQPQALIAWSTGGPIGMVFKALANAALDIPVGTTNGNMTFAQMTQYAAFLPRQLYIPSSEWPPHGAREALQPQVEQAQKVFFDAFKAEGIAPDIGATLAWDPAWIVIDGLRALDRNATAAQLRERIAALKGFAGVNGMYDFEKVPQRGLDAGAAVATLWNPAARSWQVVSKPTGIPLPK